MPKTAESKMKKRAAMYRRANKLAHEKRIDRRSDEYGDYEATGRASPSGARDEDAWYYRRPTSRESCPDGFIDADMMGYSRGERHRGEYCVRKCDAWKPPRHINTRTKTCVLDRSDSKKKLNEWQTFTRDVYHRIPKEMIEKFQHQVVWKEVSSGAGRDAYSLLKKDKMAQPNPEGLWFKELFGDPVYDELVDKAARNVVARLSA